MLRFRPLLANSSTTLTCVTGGFVTSYWFILEANRQRAVEAEIEKEMHPPSYGSVMGDKRRRKLAKFNLKGLRKVWTK